MATLPAQRRYTVAEVYAWPEDGNRYEVVHGELLVTPSPRPVHQLVIAELQRLLMPYLEPHAAHGVLIPGPGDIMWGDDVWVQPDLFVVVPEQVTASWHTYKNLPLVVEVLSPSSLQGDRTVKRGAYQENGVGTYWVVNAEKRLVEAWHPGDEAPEIVVDRLTWQVTPDAPALAIDLPTLFAKLPR